MELIVIVAATVAWQGLDRNLSDLYFCLGVPHQIHREQGASPQAATGSLPFGLSRCASQSAEPTIDPMARTPSRGKPRRHPPPLLRLASPWDSALHCVECATAGNRGTWAHAAGSACNSRASRAMRFVARLLRRSTLRENSPSPSSPPIAPRCATRGALGGDARRAKARFLTSTNQPTSNLLPAGGGFLPLPSPSGGDEERPKREDAFLSQAAPPAPLALSETRNPRRGRRKAER